MKFNLAAKLQFYFTRLNNYIVFSFEKSSINCLSFKYFPHLHYLLFHYSIFKVLIVSTSSSHWKYSFDN